MRVLVIGDEPEEYRPVPIEYGDYYVSNWGFIYSCKTHRLMRLRRKKDGHLDVNLCHNGVMRKVMVHQSVLWAFVGPCPPGMEALHADDDGGNNRLSNLSWGTRSQNHLDRTRNGGTNIRGNNNPNYKHGRDAGRNRREYMRAWYAAKKGYAHV